ncbi:MAG: ABC transporter permease [Oxalobacteraceae bacterium]|nr:ABC transporter permease [Oxalobacteraceae bacterium]
MMLSSLLLQLLNGLAGASSLFLVAAGLSLIFGVTRIVNFAHGSLTMLGLYMAISVNAWLGTSSAVGFWGSILIAAIGTALLGIVIEMLLLRRIYHVPELFQLLATFAMVLVIKDFALYVWGAEELLGPRAPGLTGAVDIFGQAFPKYNLLLIFIGPCVLLLLWLLLTRTRWGTLVRAATQDRDMVSALGVNQAWLFTSVFALGAFLAGLGGAIQMPNEPASLHLDLQTIGDAFVVVVVGGMGSLPGAYLAALLIALTKAICASLGTVHLFGLAFSFSRLTLVVEFLIMAVVLVIRPWGLLGKIQTAVRGAATIEAPLQVTSRLLKNFGLLLLLLLLLLPLLHSSFPYLLVLGIDLLIAALFAASLHFIMGPGGMHSFGHAAYFGLGAYGSALFMKALGWPMLISLLLAPLLAAVGALIFGWFCVRLSGVYLAMLTLAFAQIVWSVIFQSDELTGGSNGVTGLWPAPWLSDKSHYYYLTLCLVVVGVLLMRRFLFAPFGYALRAARDSALRSDAIGIDVQRVQWLAFVLAGVFCGVAGALFAFSKGSISPETIHIGRSVDALIMVLLGGIQTLSGPLVGSVVFSTLQDILIRETEYWRAVLGAVILFLVLVFPQGLAGFVRSVFESRGRPA